MSTNTIVNLLGGEHARQYPRGDAMAVEPEAEVRVSPDWLRLRQPADAAARSRALVRRIRHRLPDRAPTVVHDLGCGSGSMGRWLAPLLPGPQHWVLHDRDADLLDLAVGRPITCSGGRGRHHDQHAARRPHPAAARRPCRCLAPHGLRPARHDDGPGDRRPGSVLRRCRLPDTADALGHRRGPAHTGGPPRPGARRGVQRPSAPRHGSRPAPRARRGRPGGRGVPAAGCPRHHQAQPVAAGRAQRGTDGGLARGVGRGGL